MLVDHDVKDITAKGGGRLELVDSGAYSMYFILFDSRAAFLIQAHTLISDDAPDRCVSNTEDVFAC